MDDPEHAGSAEGDDGPAYLRIAEQLRRRIEDGRLRPGNRLPSTRGIVQEFGVAMATATKALGVLQSEGLARAVPGVGTIVEAGVAGRGGGSGGGSESGPGGPGSAAGRRGAYAAAPSRARIVQCGLRIADAEGLPALSLRRVAAELGVDARVLHRYVSHREHLILLMAEAAYGAFPLPEPPPPGWRRRLETAARLQWALYRRHPWLAQASSFTRPLTVPRALAHSEWSMRAFDGLGLDAVTVLHAAVAVSAHVRGLAVNVEAEAEARAHSGVTDEQWMDLRGTPALSYRPGDSAFSRLAAVPPGSLDLDSLFEFGLERLLDGIALLVDRSPRRPETR